jgi:hypothetical protein
MRASSLHHLLSHFSPTTFRIQCTLYPPSSAHFHDSLPDMKRSNTTAAAMLAFAATTGGTFASSMQEGYGEISEVPAWSSAVGTSQHLAMPDPRNYQFQVSPSIDILSA